MHRRRVLIRSAIALACAATAPNVPRRLGAQTSGTVAVPRYRLRIIGVFDEASGDPVEGVRVLDILNGSSSVTTTTGTLSLIFLPEGASLVRLQKLGYEQQTIAVEISPADTVPITVVLRRVANLPAVVTKADSARHYISPGLRGFEERRKLESGYFITEDELRKNEGRPLANVLLAKAAGVIIGNGRGSEMYLMRSPRCSNGGPPQVYLDGVPLSATPALGTQTRRGRGAPPPSGDTAPFNLMDFDITNLAAVEFYPDGALVPIQFAHTSLRYGALLLWTRER